MSSEIAETAHDHHDHPGWRQYGLIGVALIALTILEVVGYYGETQNWFGAGTAALLITVLSAAKFITVVAYYMHLKYDHKLFTGVFLFPAALGVLVIGSLYMLFQVMPTLIDEGHNDNSGFASEYQQP